MRLSGDGMSLQKSPSRRRYLNLYDLRITPVYFCENTHTNSVHCTVYWMGINLITDCLVVTKSDSLGI